MDNKIKYLSITDVKAANKEDRIVEFVATKEIRDYEGDLIKVDGMDISKLKKTKSFLWNHMKLSPPIGKIIKIWKEGKTIRGKAQMTSEEEYPFGYQIYKLIHGGYINNVSLSFLPDYKTMEYKEDKKGKSTRVINNGIAIEVSAVNIGMNNATSIEAKSFRDNIERAIEDKVVDKSTLKTYDEMMLETNNPLSLSINKDVNKVIELESKIAELELQLSDKNLEEEEPSIYEAIWNEYKPDVSDDTWAEEVLEDLKDD